MISNRSSTPALELRGIVKRFGRVVANDGVDLSIDRGEIRALVGENGAGKTTLMRVAYGILRPDEGAILIDGAQQSFASPLDAITAGLGMVHQHFMLFPELTVAENVVFGAEPTRFGSVDLTAAADRIRELSDRYSLDVEPLAVVGELSVGGRQRVEILKALYRRARILILDEPTAVLGPYEREGLYEVVEELAANGAAIVLITHKLPEVERLAHRATVMRDGALVGTVDVASSSSEEIAKMMIGRDLPSRLPKSETRPGGRILVIRDLRVLTPTGRAVVNQVSLEVHAGEILGVAGAAGNGPTELIEAIAGLRQTDSGEVSIDGRSLTGQTIAARRREGLAWLPDDRDGLGASLDASIIDNLIMGSDSDAPLNRSGLLDPEACVQLATERAADFEIKSTDLKLPLRSLSGGNRQKLVIARELPLANRVLLAEQPTRGLDFSSAARVHRRLSDYRSSGGAVLMVSSDLTEILALSDRVIVMFEGRVVGSMRSTQFSESRIGMMMAGRREAEL